MFVNIEAGMGSKIYLYSFTGIDILLLLVSLLLFMFLAQLIFKKGKGASLNRVRVGYLGLFISLYLCFAVFLRFLGQ